MRLIDADANIETMKKCAENPENEQALLCYRFAQRILEEAPTVPPAPRWVRCEDELPKPGQVCLVYDEDGYMNVATYTGDKYFPTAYGFHVNGEEVTDITNWMPIEPPREE